MTKKRAKAAAAVSDEVVANKKKQQRKQKNERRKQKKQEIKQKQLEIKEEHQRHVVELLKQNGGAEWKKLGRGQWSKVNVLAVFHSGKIPREMEEDLWHQSAPTSIRDNREILLARMARDEFVRYYEPFSAETSPCPIPVKYILDTEVAAAVVERFRDKGFMLSIFDQLYRRQPDGYNEFYCMLSPLLKCDIDLVVAANRRNSLLISNVPLELTRESKFWMDVIGRDAAFWDKLPEEQKGNSDFALAIKDFRSLALAQRVMKACLVLAPERDVWTTIIETSISYSDAMPHFIEEFAPMHIREDAELMVRACRSEPSVLEVLSAQFQERREFIAAAVDGSDEALFLISHAVQCLYPDLVATAILNLPQRYFIDGIMFRVNGRDIVDEIADALWTNLEVVKAWFSAGGWIHDKFPETLKDDKAFGLLFTEHGSSAFRHMVSETLRGDKEFMMQAVEIDSRLLLEACQGLNRDFDVALIAFTHPRAQHKLVHDLLQSSDGKMFYREFHGKVEERLRAHDGFVKGLLCGMSVHAGSECFLPMLEQGSETSLALKSLIAEYLGAPIGEQLRRARSVVRHVTDDDGTDDKSTDDDDGGMDDSSTNHDDGT